MCAIVLALAQQSGGQEIAKENQQQLVSSCGDRPQLITHACFIPRPEPGIFYEFPCGGPEIDEEAKIISSVPPEYTKRAIDERYEGTILVSLTLQEDGVARDHKIRHPVGYGLDEKAIEAVKKFAFRPASRNGRPVEVMAEVMVAFCHPNQPNQ